MKYKPHERVKHNNKERNRHNMTYAERIAKDKNMTPEEKLENIRLSRQDVGGTRGRCVL